MNRREFFLAWIFQNRRTSLEVEVLEVFSASEGPSALLVHHGAKPRARLLRNGSGPTTGRLSSAGSAMD